jgi:CzcA family heavy metal efflux pump
MFHWIIGSSLKFRFLVVAMAAAMVAVGISQVRNMPVDVFPEFAPPLVEIQTEGIGMTTAEVEEIITIPMEEALRNTPELDVIRSKTVMALSSIVMIFKRGTDIMHARQLVQERLQLAQEKLPVGIGPPVMLQPLSATSRCMKIGLASKELSMLDLSMTAYWKIRFRLLRVPGVANVAMWGERLKQLQVQVDPEKMRVHDVTLNEVEEAASEALDFGLLHYTPGGKTQIVGFIETPNQRLEIRSALPVITPEQLSEVAIKAEEGTVLRIGDVATVKWEEPLLIGDAVINDGPGMMLIVEKFPWANTLEVTRGVEAALAEMKPGLRNIDIDHEIFRPATFIELSISNLTWALLIGAVLVILILGAFLYEWRSALISVLAIPLSLAAAGLVLYAMNVTLNTMVLAGFVVALGSVVDDAIIDVENIMRRLRENRALGVPKSMARVILDASLEIRSSIVYATLIIMLAVMPVFFMGGLSGSFFEPLALSYILALLASMVVALTVTPALALILLRNAPIEHREPPLVHWLKAKYDKVLSSIIGAPRAAFSVTGLLVAAGLVIWPMLGQSLLPEFKERDFLMHWLTKPGTSHEEMYRITVQASKELRSIPGVRNFGAHIGRALVADEVVGIDFTENWISVDPKVDYDKTLHAIQEAVDGYPGIYRDVQTYLKERIREVLTGAGEAIVVRTFGPELGALREQAHKVKEALTGIPGIVDLHEELQKDIPQIEIKVDLAKASRVGLKPGDVRRAATSIFSAQEVTDIHTEGKVYDVMIWSTPETRNSLQSVQNMWVDTPEGDPVKLSDIAEVRIAPTPNVIKRENASRRIDVKANVRGRDLGSIVKDVEARLQKVELPLGYHTQILGEYAERQKAQTRLLVASLVAGLGILLLLQASFGSWRLAILARRRHPCRLAWRRRDLARVARRLPDGARHRGPQRHPADQPLSAPRAERGREVRPRTRQARGSRAAVADPDDDAGHRSRPGAARHRRQHPRPRDRAPDGGCHPRRPPDLHPFESVRGSFALPEIWGPPRRRGAEPGAGLEPGSSLSRTPAAAGRGGAPGSWLMPHSPGIGMRPCNPRPHPLSVPPQNGRNRYRRNPE